MTIKQWRALHKRIARIHEQADDVKVRSYLELAMQQVDERMAEIERRGD